MPSIEVHTVAVPWAECLTVTLGAISDDILAELNGRGFDEAPVSDGADVLGVVATANLARLQAANVPLCEKDVDTRGLRFLHLQRGDRLELASLLEALGEVRSVVLLSGDEHSSQPAGFITISDLNRQAVRAVIYHILASLESDLAFLVEHLFPEPWDWVQFLNEEAQVRVLGYWDLAKRKGVDVGPIVAATLTQLLQVGTKSSALRENLGYVNRRLFDEHSGRLPELRNRVMHPVRPLVLGPDDTAAMARALRSAVELAAKVKQAQADRGTWQGT